MASFHKESSSQAVKRKHRVLTIAEKIELLNKFNSGVSAQRLCEIYNIGISTVYDIKKNKEKLLHYFADSESKKHMCVRKSMKSGRSSELDEVLVNWFKLLVSEGVAVSGDIVREQARLLHEELGLDYESNYSKGWLYRFKNRYGLHFRAVCGEKRSADDEAASSLVNEFAKLVADEELIPEQVYNADESDLFWRCTPRRTLTTEYAESPPGFKASKDRVTLLGCSNAAGTRKSDENEAEVNVILDEYYYARKELSSTYIEEKGNFHFKCLICTKVIDNNVKVMKHLMAHIENSKQKNLDLSDLTQCKYCFRDFETPYKMQCHIESVHLNVNDLACQICNQAFSDTAQLIYHMKSMHVQSEMPYCCQVCGFRSSFHREVVEHFQQVHNNSDQMLCHYCLKVYQIKFSVAGGIGFVQGYYYHLYKHQMKSTAKKCNACCLAFFNTAEWKHHKAKDHVSMIGLEGVIPMQCHSNKLVLVKDPHKKPENNPTVKPASSKKKARRDFTVIVLPEDIDSMRCVECYKLIEKEHFEKHVSCNKCHYSTNCCEAFVEHMICMHSTLEKKRFVRFMPKESVLEKAMACHCGFLSYNGDKLALHMYNCEKIPSEIMKSGATAEVKTELEEDKRENGSAFFPPLVVLEEDEEKVLEERFRASTESSSSPKAPEQHRKTDVKPQSDTLESTQVSHKPTPILATVSKGSSFHTVKRKRCALSIKEKVGLLKKLDSGVSVKSLCEFYNIGVSTVYDIKKHKEKLLLFFADSCSNKQMGVRKSMKGGRSSELDQVLVKWFKLRVSEGVELSGDIVREQARLLHEELGLDYESNYSQGWLYRFKNRHGLNFRAVCGEDNEAATPFVDEVAELDGNEKLSSEQLYNVDETALTWQSTPRRTLTTEYAESPPDFKALKDRVTLLGCSNAAGTHKSPATEDSEYRPCMLKALGLVRRSSSGSHREESDSSREAPPTLVRENADSNESGPNVNKQQLASEIIKPQPKAKDENEDEPPKLSGVVS